jgi:ribosomal-protein-alanine N-acetyltransferase
MIKSSNVHLCKLTEYDLNFYTSLYSDKELMQYVCPLMDNVKIKKCFFNSLIKSKNKKSNHILYVIKNNLNNDRIGLIGLSWNQMAKNSAEIGVIIAKPHHRKGYAFEALNCLFRYSFEQLNIDTLIGISFANNTASNIMVEKIGFIKIHEFFNIKNNIPSIRWEITKESIK